jgi:hypothetical protein
VAKKITKSSLEMVDQLLALLTHAERRTMSATGVADHRMLKKASR